MLESGRMVTVLSVTLAHPGRLGGLQMDVRAMTIVSICTVLHAFSSWLVIHSLWRLAEVGEQGSPCGWYQWVSRRPSPGFPCQCLLLLKCCGSWITIPRSPSGPPPGTSPPSGTTKMGMFSHVLPPRWCFVSHAEKPTLSSVSGFPY